MYNQFYGFRENPFSLLPDPDFLFESRKHGAALSLLELAILNQSGFCVISGEVGAGKTTIVRELLNRIDQQVRVGLITNTHADFDDLMRWILAAFQLPAEAEDSVAMHRRFSDYVRSQFDNGRHTLLIIDEAQNLSVPALEQLRMLSNINAGNELLLQVILVGQRELRDNLLRPELEQFAQRMSIDYCLESLDPTETVGYIEHRVAHAGGTNPLFDAGACQTIFQCSGGVPRIINRLCDLSLVYGYAEKAGSITAELVAAVVNDHGATATGGANHDMPAVTRIPLAKVRPVVDNNKNESTAGGEKMESKKDTVRINAADSVEVAVSAPDPEDGQGSLPAQEATRLRRAAQDLLEEKTRLAALAVENAAAELAAAQMASSEKLKVEQRLVELTESDQLADAQATGARQAAELLESGYGAAQADVVAKQKDLDEARQALESGENAIEERVKRQRKLEEEARSAADEALARAEQALAEKIAAEKAAAEVAASSAAMLKEAEDLRIETEAEAEQELAVLRGIADKADELQRLAVENVEKIAAQHEAACVEAEKRAEAAVAAAAELKSWSEQAEHKLMSARKAQETADASRAAAERAVAEQAEAEQALAASSRAEKLALARVAAEEAESAKRAAELADAAMAVALKEAEDRKAQAEAAVRAAEAARAAVDEAVVGQQQADTEIEVRSIPSRLTDEPAMKELLLSESEVVVPAGAKKKGLARIWASMAVTAVMAGGGWYAFQSGMITSDLQSGNLAARSAAEHTTDMVVEAAAMEIDGKVNTRLK